MSRWQRQCGQHQVAGRLYHLVHTPSSVGLGALSQATRREDQPGHRVPVAEEGLPSQLRGGNLFSGLTV